MIHYLVLHTTYYYEYDRKLNMLTSQLYEMYAKTEYASLAGALSSHRDAENPFGELCTRKRTVFVESRENFVRRSDGSKRNMLKKMVKCPTCPASSGTNDDSRLLTTRARGQDVFSINSI
jgi:hypothetical protein